MAETKKLTQEELDKVRKLQNDKGEVILRLGQLESEQIRLNLEKEQLTEAFKALIGEEDKTLMKLFEKYGQGELNIDTGEVMS